MPEINPQRLMNDLRHLRTIGQYGTGVVRPAFSTKDMEARQWLLRRMKEAGLASDISVHVRNPSGTRLETTITIAPPGQDSKKIVLSKNGMNWLFQGTEPASHQVEVNI